MADTASIFGYYDRADQTTPSYDPGLDVLCPFCLRQLAIPVRTISLMLPGDNRSFFYRVHWRCAISATEEQQSQIESALIDHRAKLKDASS